MLSDPLDIIVNNSRGGEWYICVTNNPINKVSHLLSLLAYVERVQLELEILHSLF